MCAVLDSKQERQGPVFLYEGFDHSAKEDFRHPEVQNTKSLNVLQYSEHRLKKMTAEEKVRVKCADKRA